MAIDHTARLIDALEAARPTMTVGEYEAKRIQLQRMIASGDVIEVTAGERALAVVLGILGVVLPLGFVLLVLSSGGSGWMLWVVALAFVIAFEVAASKIGKQGLHITRD